MEENKDDYPSRWQLLRDVLAFQFKLLLDGLRDVLLSPISITAALVGVFTERDNPGRHFYRLMKLGHDSDRWINLFGTYDDVEAPSSDDLVRRAESMVKHEYEKGGIVSNLKNQTDHVLDGIQSKAHRNPDTGSGPESSA
jgi:hypothetical protein